MSWTILLAFWAAFALALLSPGPNFAVILGTSLRQGRAAALRVAIGFVIGEVIWGGAAIFGIAALVSQYPWIATILRTGGGLYLLYLAVRSLLAACRQAEPVQTDEPSAAPHAGGVWRGLGLMMLNPKAGVFWVSLTGLFITPESPVAMGLVAVAGAALMSLLWHGALALAFTTSMAASMYRRMRRPFEAVLGVVLTGLGLRLITAG